MTREQLKARFPHASESFLSANADPVGGLDTTKRKPNPRPALDKNPSAKQSGKGSVRVVVTLIRCGRKLLDSDNLCIAFKPLRDAIARAFGVDDADPRVTWEYGQTKTEAKTGSIVKIAYE